MNSSKVLVYKKRNTPWFFNIRNYRNLCCIPKKLAKVLSFQDYKSKVDINSKDK